jgi:AcrR family transcriptional regulator
MRLFAAGSSDTVTVAEIASEAAMTSAAIYYHYASKDDILLEGLHDFGQLLITEVRQQQRLVQRNERLLADVPGQMLLWMETHRDAATVYFTGSAGLTLSVESLRRDVRATLITRLTHAARHTRPGMNLAEAAVISVALLSLIDTSAAAWLTNDGTLDTLGRDGFLEEIASLAGRIIGG